MQPELEALLLVLLLTDAVGLGAVAALRPRRNAALRVAIVLLVPVVGTAAQLIALQLREADRADQRRRGTGDQAPVSTGAASPF